MRARHLNVSTARASHEDERRAILDAALRVMRDNGYADAQLGDILAAAGLSTRAFYRQFGSKDDLLLALYRENAEATAARLRERVAAAGSPTDQLIAWIDETLSIGYDRRRARRAAILASDAARRTGGYGEESARGAAALSAPLLEVLQSGARSGAFPSCVPVPDAATIHAIAWRLAAASISGTAVMSEPEARAHVKRFCFAALGIDSPTPELV
jgi:AcrR family transcriptional regulator